MASRALYVVSTETFAGKTAICAGLARWLEGAGRRVGYLKPLTAPQPGDEPEAGDDDARLMQRLLRLDLSARDLAPSGSTARWPPHFSSRRRRPRRSSACWRRARARPTVTCS